MRPTLIVTVALLMFGACSGGETSSSPVTPTANATAAPATAPATATPTATAPAANATAAPATATPTANATAPAGFDEPPAAIARTGSASVAMGLGSYCWTNTSTSVGRCADAVGPITGTTALRVGRGEAVTIGGEFAQMDFVVERARIRPVEGEPAYEDEDWLAWTPAARDWPSGWSVLELDAVDEGLRFTAELPAGQYLVTISLSFLPHGSAGYGLILDVQ